MARMHGQIFISYRREDSLASAGRLYDHLSARFASDRIFMDVDALEPGVDFVEAIEKSVSSCDVQAKTFENSLGMRFVPVPIYKGNGSREVTRTILTSQWQTRVKDYEAFSKSTGRSHEKPAFDQTPDDPVVNVSWEGAKAFCEWLGTRRRVRFPASRRKTMFGETPNTTRGDAYAPQTPLPARLPKVSASYSVPG